jgi:predicted MPP superfamily phosphohydrolase
MEHVSRRIYVKHWPARVWHRFPSASHLCIVRRTAVLGGKMPPLRVVFLSDLHIGPATPAPLLEKVFAFVRRCRPSILLLGGDYVYLGIPPGTLRLLEQLVDSVQCAAKFAVMGNHDLWTDDRHITRSLESAGTAVLVNRSVRLPSPWERLRVVGLDDPWAGECDAAAAFGECNDSGAPPPLVLCHSPDGLLHLGERRFSHFFCGHTHSGQVATRRGGPIFSPAGILSRRFNAGFYPTDSGMVFVSRGIGGVGIPVRVNATPDLLCLDLV